MKKIIIIFVLMLLIPAVKVKAYYCNYLDVANYKKIAYNVNYMYEYVEKNGEITFNVTLVNLNKDIYFIDTTTGKKHTFTNPEITLTGYNDGEIIKYNFYANDIYCDGSIINTLIVSLPKYNPYYNDKECEGIENFSLCQKWYSHNLTYEQFLKKIGEYKKENNTEEEIIKNVENDWRMFIIEFLVNYYYILIIIIVLCFFGIYYINKKENIYN